jgi:hypothetical protein
MDARDQVTLDYLFLSGARAHGGPSLVFANISRLHIS